MEEIKVVGKIGKNIVNAQKTTPEKTKNLTPKRTKLDLVKATKVLNMITNGEANTMEAIIAKGIPEKDAQAIMRALKRAGAIIEETKFIAR